MAPHARKRYDTFGHAGAQREAERVRATFLGEVPLEMRIRETSDEGAPVVASEPEGPHARIYRDIAAKVWERLQAERSASATPAIVFE